ncbi:MAG TPA: alpha/beta fold hydrolase [Candidatus Angelobacter sp.]|jgi:esterase/lipase superfamily enzyme
MSVFMVTNRGFVNGAFTANRFGNTWWSALPGKPIDQPANWTHEIGQEVIAQIAAIGKPIVLFIHGFNNGWQKDMDTTQAVLDGLGDAFTVVAFSWDSAGSVFEYLQDRVRAQKSASDLMEVLTALDKGTDGELNVIAHSMGNYLLQDALALDVEGTPIVDELVMVAADVDFDALNVSKISELTHRGTVMYSYRDGALWGSSDIHLAARLGLVGPGKHCPANFKGVNCTFKMPMSVVDPVEIHGYYFRSPECYQIMREALQ